MTGDSRDQFGPAWSDAIPAPLGHNGCDTRNDILRCDLLPVQVKPGTNGCVALTGTLHDPYTSTVIAFRRGAGTSTQVQIDHVVALGDAWQTGAQRWTAATRTEFANDPLNLLAVSGSANEAKGDADAASWLPANQAYRCSYVARQVAAKARYHLWVTPAEHHAIADVLASCPGQTAPPRPAQPSSPTSPPHQDPRHRAGPEPAHPPHPSTTSNCAAVRAAGKAPLYRGQPGYRPGLDRDADGIACE